jgi:hypothetical protein
MINALLKELNLVMDLITQTKEVKIKHDKGK